MINTGQFEKIFLLFALQNPKYLETTQKGFFTVPEVDLLISIAKQYYNKFKKSPSKDQLWMIITTKDLEERCTKVFFEELFKKELSDYDIEWVEETAKSWIKWKHLDSSIVDTVEYIQTQKVTPENVADIIESVKDLINGRNNLTFDDDLGVNFYDVASHIRKEEDMVSSNYNFIDKNIGGYTKGTLNVYVAPPNVGKSLFMGNDAANYIKDGKNVLVISLEMGAQKIVKRIGSNLFNININKYDDFAIKSPDKLKAKINEFKEQALVTPGQLTIRNYPTSSATADDIDNYIGKIQEVTGIEYDVVIIDYVNIMRDKRNPNSESTYIKIKNICEDLRAVAQRRNVVVISATQTTRGGFDSSSIGLGDIAESAGLAATCDNIMAIIQTPDMNLEKLYWLKLLKIRDGSGKNTKCRINIDYDYMRLTETNTIIHDDEV
jgi:replicative DNA helicase